MKSTITFLQNLIQRLSSRKFIITLGGMVAVVQFPESANSIVTLIVTFVGAEGIGDAAARYQHEKTKQTETQLEDTKLQFGVLDNDSSAPDRGNFAPGNEIPMQ